MKSSIALLLLICTFSGVHAQINLKSKVEKKADQVIDNLLFGKKKKQAAESATDYTVPDYAAPDGEETSTEETYIPRSVSFEGVDGEQLIPYTLLIDLLPESVLGIKRSEEPDGSIMKSANFNISTGAKVYNDISVTLSDYKDAAMLYGTQAGQFYEYESTDGYMRQVSIQGYNGWISGDKKGKDSNLFLSIKERYILMIDASGLSEDQLEQIANSVDLNQLP